jgi:glycosyltransferase involved in cell wall biosynthesis
LAGAGAEVIAFPGVLQRRVAPEVTVRPTLAFGKLRASYKLLGALRACAIHDYIVSRRIEKLAGRIDIIHTWPLGALRTLRAARRLGIPTVLERPNAYTAYAYDVVRKECDRLGVVLPPGSEHVYNEEVLRRETAEYDAADQLLCPSDFVVDSFVAKSFPPHRLTRHVYGYDETRFYPGRRTARAEGGMTMLFAGYAAVRKGVHIALEAWLRSPASRAGQFLIAGEFATVYADKLRNMLSHPSVKVLGHRKDVPDLMRQSDVMVLPSLEEGFGLVCVEAMGCGCVPLVSNACTDVCKHMENAMVHRVGDTDTLCQHITALRDNPALLASLREGALATAPTVTWAAAGAKLLQAYADVIRSYRSHLGPLATVAPGETVSRR